MPSSTLSRIELLRATALALLLAGGSALAGNADDEQERRIREQLATAQAAYDLGQFEEALGAYSEAYRLSPLPGILFNIGQCHRKLGHEEQALFILNRYLDLAPAAKNAALARQLVRELEVRRARERRAESTAAALRRRELEQKAASSLTDPAMNVEPDTRPALLQHWWLWAGIGVVAAAAATTAAIVVLSPQPAPAR